MRAPRWRILLGVIVAVVCLGALGVALAWDRIQDERDGYLRSRRDASQHITDVRTEVIATGLHTVWDIEVMAPGRLLVLERPGRVRLIENGRLRAEPYLVLKDVAPGQHLGLFDLEKAPDYAQSHHVYISYSAQHLELLPIRDKAWMRDSYSTGAVLTVLRYTDTGYGLEQPTRIFAGDLGESTIEPAGRMTFGPDGKLYLAHGNFSHHTYDAQNLRSFKGKILRLNPDGSVPSDNPFVGKADVRPEIFSYGHKNSYGLQFDPVVHDLIEVSHGPTGNRFRPKGWDEINIIRAGANYGWPWAWGHWNAEGMEAPAFLWEEQPSMAPGSAVFYSGSLFPAWKGDLLVTGLQSMTLLRFRRNGSKIALVEKIMAGGEARLRKRLGLRPLTGLGRLRGIAVDGDGTVYVGTSNAEREGGLIDIVAKVLPEAAP